MNDCDKLINNLSYNIDKKCSEIKKKKHDIFMTKVFITGCILTLIVPAVLVILGGSLKLIFLPIIIIMLLFMLLGSIVSIGGIDNEEVQ